MDVGLANGGCRRLGTVVADANAPSFGLRFDDRLLTPSDNPRLGAIDFEAWPAKR